LLDRLPEAASPRSAALALAGIVVPLGAAVQRIGNFNLPAMSNLTCLAAALAPTLCGEC
jgi:hypothetical protein